MTDRDPYTDLPTVDVALNRASLRRATERAKGNTVAVEVYDGVIDRLLARRFVLMTEAAS